MGFVLFLFCFVLFGKYPLFFSQNITIKKKKGQQDSTA